jgi:hypothetical protein
MTAKQTHFSSEPCPIPGAKCTHEIELTKSYPGFSWGIYVQQVTVKRVIFDCDKVITTKGEGGDTQSVIPGKVQETTDLTFFESTGMSWWNDKVKDTLSWSSANRGGFEITAMGMFFSKKHPSYACLKGVAWNPGPSGPPVPSTMLPGTFVQVNTGDASWTSTVPSCLSSTPPDETAPVRRLTMYNDCCNGQTSAIAQCTP